MRDLCTNRLCPLSENCCRIKDTPDYWQTMATFTYTVGLDGFCYCDHYKPIWVPIDPTDEQEKRLNEEIESGVGNTPTYNGEEAEYNNCFVFTWIVCIVVVLWIIFKRKNA